MLDDGRTKLEHFADIHMQAERRVLPVSQLDDPRHPHEIDPGRELEAPDERRTGKYEDRELWKLGDQRLGNGSAPTQVTEPEGIMTVDEYASDVGLSHYRTTKS